MRNWGPCHATSTPGTLSSVMPIMLGRVGLAPHTVPCTSVQNPTLLNPSLACTTQQSDIHLWMDGMCNYVCVLCIYNYNYNYGCGCEHTLDLLVNLF